MGPRMQTESGDRIHLFTAWAGAVASATLSDAKSCFKQAPLSACHQQDPPRPAARHSREDPTASCRLWLAVYNGSNDRAYCIGTTILISPQRLRRIVGGWLHIGITRLLRFCIRDLDFAASEPFDKTDS